VDPTPGIPAAPRCARLWNFLDGDNISRSQNAAWDQFAKGQGMTVSSAFVMDMMDDASDGTMNGMMGGSMMQSSAGTTGLATAMTGFMGSTMNRSGLTAADMNMLIQKLSSSIGQL
jgi:hypothetical protein